MFQFSKIKKMIAFVSFCQFIKVELTNYISFELIKADDCVRMINISNEILFNFTLLYNGTCNNLDDLGHCDAGNYSMYPDDKYLIKNYEYEYKIAIIITFEDWNHIDGFMDMNVYFNEFKIKTSDQVFWRCINCGNGYKGYYWENSRMNYYHDYGGGGCSEKLYYFVFQIDNITELYKGGENGALEVNNNFYTFTDNSIFERVIYSTENELELINFNVPEILHVKLNDSLPINYNNYYFKIEYDQNTIKGDLTGLDLNDEERKLYNGNEFKVTNTSGLNYVLTEEEKDNKYTEIKVRISVCNYCLNGINGNKCNYNVIVPPKEFTFKIKIIDPPTTKPTEKPTTTLTERPTTTPTERPTTPPTQRPTSTPIERPTTTATERPTTTPTERLTTTPTERPSTTPTERAITISTEKPSSSDTLENISKDTSIQNSDNISYGEIFDCLKIYFSLDKQNDIYSHLCPDFSKDNIKDNLDMILQKIDDNKNYKIIGADIIIQIFPFDENNTNNTDIFPSSSYTNFTECEKILRESNEYYSPRKITFVQIELNNTNDDILVNQI